MTGAAIVTGAGGGIGRAVALALLSAGYRVALAGRRPEALERTAALSEAPPERCLALPTDIRDEAAVHDLFERVLAAFGRLDVLFNNAGIGARAATIDELEVEEWRRVVATNLTGSFLCAREAFRIMRRQRPRGGRIINNGSVSAHVPRPMSAPYTASKHAITGLTRAISLDGRAFDIACGQIDIGNAATPMTAAMARGVPQAHGEVAPEPTFEVDHAARAVLAMAQLPLDANVQFMTLMATAMPYIGRG